MEYILGSIVTLASVVVLNRLLRKSLAQNNFKFQLTQSYLFKLLSEYNNFDKEDVLQDTQAFNHVKNQYVKVMIFDKEAYWIKDNQLYVADFINGEVDSSTTRQVDTMSMSKVELERTMFVVEKLSEGDANDNSGSGKS